MDDIVQADTCVCLNSKEELSENPCTIDISAGINGSIAIKTIHIVSQCRLLEVFGHYGEYLNTFHGDLFDEFEDTSIYVTKVKLKSPLTTLSIKFVRLKESQFWIYGIYLTKINITQTSQINLQKFGNQPVEDSKLSMDTALCQASSPVQFQNFVQTSSNQDLSHLPYLLSKLIGGAGPILSDKTAEMVHSTVNNANSVYGEKICKPLEASEEFIRIKDIKPILNQELQGLEANIFSHVNKRFNQLEKKQDLIMNKLDLLLNSLKIVNDGDQSSNETNGKCVSYHSENIELEHDDKNR